MTTDNQSYSTIDHLGRQIIIPFPPKRIVSVVPSQTELLFDLGLAESIVGVTWFCIHPQEAKSKTQVGGTKNLKLEKISSLNPDLIIANKEENDQGQIEWLADRFPVWISDIKTITNALDMIMSVGDMTDKTHEAGQIIQNIKNTFKELAPTRKIKTLYLIWKEPYMAVGSDTFIGHILELCGLTNLAGKSNRYPEYSIDELKALNPELILLSSEPFPFKEKHLNELKIILPNTEIKLVDGEMFSWYGSRLIAAGSYLKNFISSL